MRSGEKAGDKSCRNRDGWTALAAWPFTRMISAKAFARRSCSNKAERDDPEFIALQQDYQLTQVTLSCTRTYSYLNSGIAFSSSLVVLNTAWSGYQVFDFDELDDVVAGGLAVDPVVVEAGRLPAGAFDAPV